MRGLFFAKLPWFHWAYYLFGISICAVSRLACLQKPHRTRRGFGFAVFSNGLCPLGAAPQALAVIILFFSQDGTKFGATTPKPLMHI